MDNDGLMLVLAMWGGMLVGWLGRWRYQQGYKGASIILWFPAVSILMAALVVALK